jgi:predicted SnoaL-like aldol condensation-catalyzing enzyme
MHADSRLEANKGTVLAFYEVGLNQKNFTAASKLPGAHYVQHNPRIADGIEGFQQFLDHLKREFPALRAEVKHVFADGDFVVAHVHGVRVPGQRGVAIVDIFRLEDGRIVEHWDVMEPIPEDAANRNGMF